ncbi:DUF1707 domain-containing protein [Spiractinospora alimapuensis]|nr:DUF1707 domain-containing protein [Spiractinospora alimapuensis]
MRAADSDRDQVAERLREAAAEGRIALDELDERLERTYQARTYGDLIPITADLPDGQVAPAAGAAHLARQGGEVLELREKMGNIIRRGQWVVPHKIVLSNPGGATRLDFREASFQSSQVEIEVTLSWGSADLIFPPGVTAQLDLDTSWMGHVVNKLDEVGGADGMPHVRITGECKGGYLRTRYGRVRRRK